MFRIQILVEVSDSLNMAPDILLPTFVVTARLPFLAKQPQQVLPMPSLTSVSMKPVLLRACSHGNELGQNEDSYHANPYL